MKPGKRIIETPEVWIRASKTPIDLKLNRVGDRFTMNETVCAFCQGETSFYANLGTTDMVSMKIVKRYLKSVVSIIWNFEFRAMGISSLFMLHARRNLCKTRTHAECKRKSNDLSADLLYGPGSLKVCILQSPCRLNSDMNYARHCKFGNSS